MNKKSIIAIISVFAVSILMCIPLMRIENDRKFHEKWGILADMAEDDSRVKYITENEEQYPKELIDYFYRTSMDENDIDFLYNYPFHKDDYNSMSYTSDELNSDTVPALYMNDNRWRYQSIGDGVIEYDGCVTLSLTMAYLYLKNDGNTDPYKIAQIAENIGALGILNGISGEEIENICAEIGLNVKVHRYNEDGTIKKISHADLADVKQIIDSGHVLMAALSGESFGNHAIIITGCDGDMLTINDPASAEKTNKKWKFGDIENELIYIFDISG